MKLADIDGRRMMDWLLAVQFANDRLDNVRVEFHVVGQGYELQAPGTGHLFIEPRREGENRGE